MTSFFLADYHALVKSGNPAHMARSTLERIYPQYDPDGDPGSDVADLLGSDAIVPEDRASTFFRWFELDSTGAQRRSSWRVLFSRFENSRTLLISRVRRSDSAVIVE